MFVDVLLGFTVDCALPRGLAVVVHFLALRQGNLALDHVLFQVDPGRYEGESLFLDAAREFIQFLPVEQQSPVAQRFVIGVTPCHVRTDVAINEPRLAALNIHIAVFEVDLPVPNGLHFGSGQLDARLKPLQQVIEMWCLPVDGKVLRSGLGRLWHNPDGLTNSSEIGNFSTRGCRLRVVTPSIHPFHQSKRPKTRRKKTLAISAKP